MRNAAVNVVISWRSTAANGDAHGHGDLLVRQLVQPGECHDLIERGRQGAYGVDQLAGGFGVADDHGRVIRGVARHVELLDQRNGGQSFAAHVSV